jgi:hypothetical protein
MTLRKMEQPRGCNKCGQTKSVNEFWLHGDGQRETICRVCRREQRQAAKLDTTGLRVGPLSPEEVRAIASDVLRKAEIHGGRDEVLRIRMDHEGTRFVWKEPGISVVVCPKCGCEVSMIGEDV